MFFALNKNTNKRVDIEEALKEKIKSDYICPLCYKDLIMKKGVINASHFAHKVKCDETFSTDMSIWHKEWQDIFPKENQEVIVECDIATKEYAEAMHLYGFGQLSNPILEAYRHNEIPEDAMIHIKHRADVLINNYVIEFQHSPISREEFNARNWFYSYCGYKIIWVFDMSDKEIELIRETYTRNTSRGLYKWSYALKTFRDFDVVENKDVIKLYFQFDFDDCNRQDKFIEAVTWATPEFNRFYTDDDKAVTAEDLLRKVQAGQI